MRSSGVRLMASLVLLAVAALLLVPAPAVPRRTSWERLIAPLRVGVPVARGYVLSPPRRGDGHDVVYVARRDPGAAGPLARIEVHILDRGQWSGVSESRSFAVGWEVPPAGSTLPSPPEDARAVTETLFEAISKNDTGFPSVDAIPLTSEPDAPPISRVLDRLSGMRGALIGGSVAIALVFLASIPRGAIIAGLLLFAVGLVLRVSSLDLPFAHDQDVQRLFTGHLPLREIATGIGLKDRHPPLYFFILHVAQQFGQSEAVVRAPAVLAGALAGPALLLATASMGGQIGAAAVLAALAVTVSPELIARSREVSEIPLYALMLVAAAASVVAALRAPRLSRLVAVAMSHALALFTYYLAPFVVAAHAAVLMWTRAPRRVVVAFVAGLAAALPALMLGMVTLLRDWGARDVARAFPALAWGEHVPTQMATQMAGIAVGAFGVPFVALALVAVTVGIARGYVPVLTPALGVAATFAGIALLSPIARVQGYYVTTVLPLAALTVAVLPEPVQLTHRIAWIASLVLAIVFSAFPSLGRAGGLYVPDADAFMRRFASVIAQRPERTIVTVAHYDKALLAYYLARGGGRSIDWASVDSGRRQRIEPLVMVHALDAQSEETAAERLEQIVAAGSTLVVERDAFLLPRVSERLSTCERLDEAPTARLFLCTPPGAVAN